MGWLVKPQKIYLELVASWLRSEITKLSHVLNTIEETQDYHNADIQETIRTAEAQFRRIRKFIEAN